MEEGTTFNRWLVVLGGFLINLMLGVIYAWSVFIKPLEAEFGWSRAQTSLTFSLVVAFFSIGMVPAGRWQDQKGPRLIAMIGGGLLGISWILASFTNSLPWLYVTYGVLGGFGIGMAYVTPVATGVKWFPDKRGIVTGLIVMGFGLGAAFLAPIAVRLIETSGWRSAFLYMGALFIIVIVAGAQLLKVPPAGYSPPGWTPPAVTDSKKVTVAHKEYEWQEMIKTPQFWFIWLMYFFTAGGGLMAIGQLKPFAAGQLAPFFEAGGVFMGVTAATLATTYVGVFSIFNGLGRPGMGAVSDKTGRTMAMVIDFVVMGALFAIILGFRQPLMLFASFAIIAFMYGGILALMPSITADYFGTKNMGLNYGAVFTAWGAGGLVFNTLGGYLFDLQGSYSTPFLLAAALCIVSAVMAFIIKRPAE